MRNFLTHLNIVGGVNVWSEGEICRYAIEDLIKWCDKVVIMMDNSDEKTTGIVMEYKNKYPEIVVTGETNVPPLAQGERSRKRLKLNSCWLTQCLLEKIKEEHDKRPIDIFLFKNSDEIFTNSLPDVLTRFITSKADTIFIKPIEVYDDFHILTNKGLISHARIYKYCPEISAIPQGVDKSKVVGIIQRDYFVPHRTRRNIMRANYTFVHLQRLTKENRTLRAPMTDYKQTGISLWRVSKPAYELTPSEAHKVYTSKNLLPIKDYNSIDDIPLTL